MQGEKVKASLRLWLKRGSRHVHEAGSCSTDQLATGRNQLVSECTSMANVEQPTMTRFDRPTVPPRYAPQIPTRVKDIADMEISKQIKYRGWCVKLCSPSVHGHTDVPPPNNKQQMMSEPRKSYLSGSMLSIGGNG